MKYLLAVLVLFCCISCNDDSPSENIEEKDVRMTDVSGVTLNYTKDLEIGSKENEIIFEKETEILDPDGRMMVKTLDCCGLAAVALNGIEVDTLKPVERVTIINRGTITVHTKDLVERYKHLIATPEDPDRPYYYLRVLVIYAGSNCTVINKGVINVYFDHDPLNTSTIYTIALTGDDGSTVINDGEINFFGNGSVNTRFRGIATQGDYVTAINNGVMTSNVEMVEDQIMITTGGEYNNIINDGIMRLHGPGKICGLTRYGNSNIINNNLIDITHVDMPDKYVAVTQKANTVGGMFCKLPLLSTAPPMVNRGTINMKTITTSNTLPSTTIHGIFFDYLLDDEGSIEASAINEGTITTAQTGPIKLDMAEAFFRSRTSKPVKVKMSRWNTTLRDFTKQPLFISENANFDFAGGELVLVKGKDYVEDTPYSVAPERLFRPKKGSIYSGYETMTILSKDKSLSLSWDKTNQKVFLSSKQ